LENQSSFVNRLVKAKFQLCTFCARVPVFSTGTIQTNAFVEIQFNQHVSEESINAAIYLPIDRIRGLNYLHMKFWIIAGLHGVLAVRTTTRYDRSSPFDDHLIVSFREIAKETTGKTEIAGKAAEVPFKFMFECGQSVSSSQCQNAEKVFESAGNRIAEILKIKQTIIVNVKYHSFCETGNESNCRNSNNTLGRASSAAYFPVRLPLGAEVYLYPQSLVKQLQAKERLNMASVDIFAEFNSDFPFYFANSNRPIQPDEIDFEFVVGHELTHGLGFESGWVHYGYYYKSKRQDYLAPLPYAFGSTSSAAKVSSFSPLTVFDAYLYAEGKGLSGYDRAVFQFNGKGLSIREFIQQFENSGSPLEAARNVMRVSTNPDSSLSFQAKSLGKIALNSQQKFVQGTSMSHVHQSSADGKEFLMVPAVNSLKGISLDGMIARSGSGYIYGPMTREIMQTLGWPTKDSPNPPGIQIVDYSASISRVFYTTWILLGVILW
jgi:hypothetical protein